LSENWVWAEVSGFGLVSAKIPFSHGFWPVLRMMASILPEPAWRELHDSLKNWPNFPVIQAKPANLAKMYLVWCEISATKT
jgi:hypothetical protein